MANIALTPDGRSPSVLPHKARFSVPSIIALVAMILSFTVSPGWALLWGMIAILFGLLGVVMSLSPSVRGGVVSFVSIPLGAIAIIGAIIRVVVNHA